MNIIYIKDQNPIVIVIKKNKNPINFSIGQLKDKYKNCIILLKLYLLLDKSTISILDFNNLL